MTLADADSGYQIQLIAVSSLLIGPQPLKVFRNIRPSAPLGLHLSLQITRLTTSRYFNGVPFATEVI